MARVMTVVFAILCMAGSIKFLATFRENLHCTQYTSFRLATFDMEPHEEEEADGGPPLVYHKVFAYPLRAYLAGSLLAFLFLPPLASIQIVRRRWPLRRWQLVAAGTAALVFLNTLLPDALIGERFSALEGSALGFAIIPLLILVWLVQAAAKPSCPCEQRPGSPVSEEVGTT
ncbi:MAG TPA: hypothetical protein VF173_16815 [Thermoanaerobaculia bacterium]|nr:hypothetical protein [Thermoanaerobaculia bacterium]